MNTSELLQALKSGKFDCTLSSLYPDLAQARLRYIGVVDNFIKYYGPSDGVRLFSAPGRSEICGNHTDHNNGKAIGAAVDLDTVAVASMTADRYVRVKSEGFEEDRVNLDRISPRFNDSEGMIMGVIDGFSKRGFGSTGFNAYTASRVPSGSGLSSSAAFENLIGAILNGLFAGMSVPSDTLAHISQYSENEFFGKPCGLLDQMSSAVGDMVLIDFASDSFEKLNYDFNDLDLVIIRCAGSHADLGGDYAAIREEMRSVAGMFGKKVLRDCTREQVFSYAARITEKLGDRAFLRAMHYFNENERVLKAAKAIREKKKADFLSTIKSSGESSYTLLQNIYCPSNPIVQPLSTALLVCSELLSGSEAAWRVHGGGFAGTVQAFVPKSYSHEFVIEADKLLSGGKASILQIRKQGAIEVCAD